MGVSKFLQTAFNQFEGQARVIGHQEIGGGSINRAAKVMTSIGEFFIKWNDEIPEDMFPKEWQGLKLLRKSNAVRVPNIHFEGDVNGVNFLIMEWLERASQQSDYWSKLGEQLANLHSITDRQHGLDYDNYIGRLPQSNQQEETWVDFFQHQRLKPQMALAKRQGLLSADMESAFLTLFEKLPSLIPELGPSLLHGDLWSGNVVAGPEGLACVIDPAVYFGSREIEIAFTMLFGGFGQDFYDTYYDRYPLEPGFNDRAGIYNLYPLLVHVNLFGSSYLSGISHTLNRFV